jgi:hypothetical protein
MAVLLLAATWLPRAAAAWGFRPLGEFQRPTFVWLTAAALESSCDAAPDLLTGEPTPGELARFSGRMKEMTIAELALPGETIRLRRLQPAPPHRLRFVMDRGPEGGAREREDFEIPLDLVKGGERGVALIPLAKQEAPCLALRVDVH